MASAAPPAREPWSVDGAIFLAVNGMVQVPAMKGKTAHPRSFWPEPHPDSSGFPVSSGERSRARSWARVIF